MRNRNVGEEFILEGMKLKTIKSEDHTCRKCCLQGKCWNSNIREQIGYCYEGERLDHISVEFVKII